MQSQRISELEGLKGLLVQPSPSCIIPSEAAPVRDPMTSAWVTPGREKGPPNQVSLPCGQLELLESSFLCWDVNFFFFKSHQTHTEHHSDSEPLLGNDHLLPLKYTEKLKFLYRPSPTHWNILQCYLNSHMLFLPSPRLKYFGNQNFINGIYLIRILVT